MAKIRTKCWRCKSDVMVYSMFEELPKKASVLCAVCRRNATPSRFAGMIKKSNPKHSGGISRVFA